MEKEFIAQHKIGAQISPDDWGVFNKTLKVTEYTTVGEILEWYREDKKEGSFEVKLIQIQ